MTTKKGKTKKQKVKRDMMDFIKDASRKDSTVGMDFLNEFNKKGVKAKDLHQLLISWGYDGVRLKDCTKLIAVKAAIGEIKPDWMRKAY